MRKMARRQTPQEKFERRSLESALEDGEIPDTQFWNARYELDAKYGEPEFTIERKCVGHAYARNGYADANGLGTPRYEWNVFDADGRLQGGGYSYRRDAVDLIENWLYGGVAK